LGYGGLTIVDGLQALDDVVERVVGGRVAVVGEVVLAGVDGLLLAPELGARVEEVEAVVGERPDGVARGCVGSRDACVTKRELVGWLQGAQRSWIGLFV